MLSEYDLFSPVIVLFLPWCLQGLGPSTARTNSTPLGNGRGSSRQRVLMGGAGVLGGGPATPGSNAGMIYSGGHSGEFSVHHSNSNGRIGRNMAAAQSVATSLLRGVLSGFAGASHKHLASQPLESKRDSTNRQRVNGDPNHAGIVSPHSGGGVSHSPAVEQGILFDQWFRSIDYIVSILSTYPILLIRYIHAVDQYLLSSNPLNAFYQYIPYPHTLSPHLIINTYHQQKKMRSLAFLNRLVVVCYITPGNTPY